jgi:hypothetical protein
MRAFHAEKKKIPKTEDSLAEGVGFEPMVTFQPRRFSSSTEYCPPASTLSNFSRVLSPAKCILSAIVRPLGGQGGGQMVPSCLTENAILFRVFRGGPMMTHALDDRAKAANRICPLEPHSARFRET